MPWHQQNINHALLCGNVCMFTCSSLPSIFRKQHMKNVAMEGTDHQFVISVYFPQNQNETSTGEFESDY